MFNPIEQGTYSVNAPADVGIFEILGGVDFYHGDSFFRISTHASMVMLGHINKHGRGLCDSGFKLVHVPKGPTRFSRKVFNQSDAPGNQLEVGAVRIFHIADDFSFMGMISLTCQADTLRKAFCFISMVTILDVVLIECHSAGNTARQEFTSKMVSNFSNLCAAHVLTDPIVGGVGQKSFKEPICVTISLHEDSPFAVLVRDDSQG